MSPLLSMALTQLPDEKLEELEKDMDGIPEEVERGDVSRLLAVGQKFGVDVTPEQAAALLPK